MKKRITLLIAAALMAVAGVQARMVKTQEFKLTDSEFVVSYTGTNSVNAETGELSLAGNASCAWDKYYAATKYDLSTSDFFVVKLKEAATQDLFVVLSTEGFWGTVGDNGTGYIGTLAAGQTELSIPLSGLKNNQEGKTKYGETIDLTKINMINLWTGGSGAAYTYKIDEVYAEAYAESYDKVQSVATKTYITCDDTEFSLRHWPYWSKTEEGKTDGYEDNTYDTATGTLVMGPDGSQVGWTFATGYDVSEYTSLVIKVKSVTGSNVDVRLIQDGKAGFNNQAGKIATTATAQTYTIDLTGLKTTNEDSDNHQDITTITGIRFWKWSPSTTIVIDEIYFEKPGEPIVYLVRENMESGKYGTICLPFAASVPGNATVYDVVGWNATNVYLNEVTELEAGKGYVFQSTDAEDITFTKTGAADNLTEPARGNALDGYFDAAERYVPAESYILVGSEWKRVPSANRNQVGLYRAYFTKVASLEVTTPPAGARAMTFDGGETTGIDEVPSSKIQVSGSDIFDLSGRKVSQPMRGIYVKNGKKYVVK